MDFGFKTWGISLDFWSQWRLPWGKRWNWYDFTVIHLEVEHSPYKGSNEASVGLLGLNLRVTVWKRFYTSTFNNPIDDPNPTVVSDTSDEPGAE